MPLTYGGLQSRHYLQTWSPRARPASYRDSESSLPRPIETIRGFQRLITDYGAYKALLGCAGSFEEDYGVQDRLFESVLSAHLTELSVQAPFSLSRRPADLDRLWPLQQYP